MTFELFLIFRQKTQTFCGLLESFEKIYKWLGSETAKNEDDISSLNLKIGAGFPDLSDLLAEWKSCFDAEKAKKDGKLIPKEGSNSLFDSAVEKIEIAKKSAETLRAKYEVKHGLAKILKSGKMHFCLELKENIRVKDDWTVIGSRKNRFNFFIGKF